MAAKVSPLSEKAIDAIKSVSAPRVPANLAEIMADGFPSDALQIDVPYAIFTFFRVWATVILSAYLLIHSPWYLVPFAWILLGTAVTGLFVIGHDCAHQCFTSNRLLNEIFGTICMMPIAFPFNCWEITHNNHHSYTNNLDRDHVWRPFRQSEVAKMARWQKFLVYYMFGPLFFESSLIHHAYHFILPLASRKNRMGQIRSIIFAAYGFYLTTSTLSNYGSVWKLFVVPFLIFQFWMSTFTYFHHRHVNSAGWKPDKEWDKVYGSLFTTVHVDYPAWIEWLTLNINWHLPHHVSAQVPWYNLRKTTFCLATTYGKSLAFDEFGWRLWRETTTQCHMYDEKTGYAPMPEF